MNAFFGNLTLAAFRHGAIIEAADLFMIVAGLTGLGALIYYRRLGWLWREWLTSLDPKRIGVMYIAIAIVMLLKAAFDAAMMRAQQALAAGGSQGFLSPEHFQQLFTTHGTTMIFFVAMGLMFGMINLILPLQIGSRDVAFPFLNSVSFWLYAAGALLVNTSLVIGEFGATGWLAYPPLSELAYSPGPGVDYWIWSLQVSGAGSLLSGINFLVTIFKMRAPGMTPLRMPMFVWTVLASMTLLVFAFPVLTATLLMLSLDRLLGMHFFTAMMGGNAMMYINLIWMWGHPEVYILVLPAFGVFSEVVATFSQKRLFGYMSMVYATAAITLFSFVVWLHHFFTMGAGADVNAFFGIMTMVIAVPTGVKVFNWIFTMFRGKVIYSTPMYWFMGFVATFVLGGAAGVMLAVPGIDFELHNSLFLVAHFHTMVIGGVVFGFFAAFDYWFPKFAGFKLDERLGKSAFWCWLVGFFLAFVPLYILGFMGATRRLDHYDAPGWQPYFITAAVGVAVIACGILLQIIQVIVSVRQRKENRDMTGDPWNGRTLEWSVSSPPPAYNFAAIPVVNDRDAFWAQKQISHQRMIHARDDADHGKEIFLPKNTSLGILVGLASFLTGFGLVWHIVWLAALGILSIIAIVILRSWDEETEYALII